MLGALSLFNAVPAQAQTTIWSATITVHATAGPVGYCNIPNFYGGDNSADEECIWGSLSDGDATTQNDNQFTLGGTTYTVRSIRQGEDDGAPAKTHLTLDKSFPTSQLSTLTLQVGSANCALSDATHRTLTSSTLDHNYRWSPTSCAATLGTATSGATVTVKILQQTQPTTTVSLSASPNPVTEGSPTTVTATLSETLSSAVTIPVTITDDSAESGDHGTLTSITINAGATSGAGTISTNQDADQDDETFTVALGSPLPSGVTAGTPRSVPIRISDDDSTYVLSVEATPECGTRVTDTSVTPTMVRVLTPAPRMPEAVQYRLLADTPQDWIGTGHPIRTNGRSVRTESADFAHLRRVYGGFTGFEYRLTNHTGVTAQCTWTFTGDPVPPQPPPPQPIPPTPGPPTVSVPPTGGGPPPAGPSDPTPDSDTPAPCGESDTEDLESFYEATGGDAWYRSEDWNSEEPLDQWFGVDTDEDGEVISLRLSDNNLSGDMPTEELLCLTELKELALWDNEDLSGEVPDELVLAVERAALREIAEMLDINPEWFEDYEEPFDFEDWHEGVTTDDDGRVTELHLPGEIPENIRFQFKKLTEIMITTSSDGGCAVGASSERMGASGLLAAVFIMLLAVSRGFRTRSY